MSRTALADYLTELLWDGAVSAARRQIWKDPCPECPEMFHSG